MSTNVRDGPGLPLPVTANTQTDDDAPTPSKWIRTGKHVLLWIRGILAVIAVATFISAIACSASKIKFNTAIYGSAAYSFVFNFVAILFTFRCKPIFHEEGFVSQKAPALVRALRRWPGIPLTIIDLVGIGLLMLVTKNEDHGESYNKRLYQVTFGLSSGSGAGHFMTMCAGWLFGLVCIFRKCCIGQRRRDKKQTKKIEALYERAKAERKAKELEEANKVVVPGVNVDGRKMTKKEKLEAAYEKARIEREMVERMVKEEAEKEKGTEMRGAATTETTVAPQGSAEEAPVGNGGLVEHYNQVEKQVGGQEKRKMTKKERLEAAYERARIEREAMKAEGGDKVGRKAGDKKGKGKVTSDDMV